MGARDMSATLTITAEQKPRILAALYNAARPLGMGFLHFTPEAMTEAEAEVLLAEATLQARGQCYFDYLKGRVMKMDFSGDELRFDLYDRDNGQGKGLRVAQAAVSR
jgi:hypothetical protein